MTMYSLSNLSCSYSGCFRSSLAICRWCARRAERFRENDTSDFMDESDFSYEETREVKKDNCKMKCKKISKNKSNISRRKSKTLSKEGSQVIEFKATSMYMCMYCRNRFTCYDKLKEHMTSNDDCKNARLTCKTCGKILNDRKSMYQHTLSHKEKEKYICDECGKCYTNIFSMDSHKAIMHGHKEELDGIVYKCKICSSTFNTKRDLFLHVNNHTKEQVHLCDTCGKCFNTQDNLRSHLRTHSELKPFVCEVCAKQFRTKLALVQHSHSHTGFKPFSCEICSKMFSKKSSLASHIKQHTG